MIRKPTAVVRTRIDEHIKATTVLVAMGLTISDAFRIMLTRIAKEKVLPSKRTEKSID